MTPASIAPLLVPYAQHSSMFPDPLLSQLSVYLDLLLRWNARTNLTAIRAPEEIVSRHFGESLFAARKILSAVSTPAANPSTLADIGSGAGFPGIPIKLWSMQIKSPLHVSLIESHHKKATFLREAIRTLQLSEIDVQATRAEQVSQRFNVVTLRAVERFADILPTAASLVQPKGYIALLIGDDQIATSRALLPTFKWDEPAPIPNSQRRVLLLGQAPEGT